MFRYILRRVLISIPTLFGISIIIFVLANLMPGDAMLAMLADDTTLSREVLEEQRARVGLDDPLPVRYVRWMGNVLQGNLGYSFVSSTRVGEAIMRRIPPTVELMGAALLFALVVGITLGVISALKQYSALDYALTIFGFAGLSLPVFFVGMLFIYIFALRLDWLPPSGMRTAGEPYTLRDNLEHLLLPALAIGLLRTVTFMRYTRSSMLEVMSSDYLMTARAKGLRPHTIITVHAMRNALIPIVTVLGLSLPTLLAGAVYVETIFQWPGMGLLFIRAVTQRDHPMIMGIALVSSVAVLVSNLLIDITYAFIDPRIRYE